MKIEKVNDHCFYFEYEGYTFFFPTLEKAELSVYRAKNLFLSPGFYAEIIIKNDEDKIIVNRRFSTNKDFVAKFFELNNQNR